MKVRRKLTSQLIGLPKFRSHLWANQSLEKELSAKGTQLEWRFIEKPVAARLTGW
jgi:hypothetical protein